MNMTIYLSRYIELKEWDDLKFIAKKKGIIYFSYFVLNNNTMSYNMLLILICSFKENYKINLYYNNETKILSQYFK